MLLISGITGHTGKYFLQQLSENNYNLPIRCIVREESDVSLLNKSKLNIQKVVGDIDDEFFLDECTNGVDTIVHIVNIRYTLKILKAAVKNNVKRVICVHTTGIYSKFRIASEEYIEIEKEIKEILSESNINFTILRPTMIYGDICDRNMSKFIKMVDHIRLFPVINKGENLIQPVNARDLGKAYYDILMMPSDKAKFEYVLSGDKPIKMVDALKLISKNLNKKTVFISFPIEFGVSLAIILNLITFGKINFIERVKRMSEDRSFSHEIAFEDFSYSPELFEIGIEREVKEYLSKKQVKK